MECLTKLEKIQHQILKRITNLELSNKFSTALSLQPTKQHSGPETTESLLSSILRSNGVYDFAFKRVPSHYYDTPLEARRDILDAPSVHHLCKSIVLVVGACGDVMVIIGINIRKKGLHVGVGVASGSGDTLLFTSSPHGGAKTNRVVGYCSDGGIRIGLGGMVVGGGGRSGSGGMVNTQAHESVTDCSDRNNSKYYVVVVQYSARFSAETVKNFLYSVNNGKIPKKRFNLRLAPEEESTQLTGYKRNGVTCVGMKTDIPVILDEAITKLNPDFFWLGGGEIDLKLGIRTSQFISLVKPYIVSCSST
ncbi:hypothetical protein IFM89_009981 [Coptis chinensis]|uniref:YbaK/aminoacyl-tRNA synthetase-associated domain-containing protein n=1 Tax=Coptis chinensis TaxID=261450 RepID=A0A835LPY2_9MAGN|nr:hypothetical protein IFM89_009981 [Coptis chinensis]